MSQQSTEIEVEIVEIDGVTPTTPQAQTDERPQHRGDWRNWHGRVRQLDSRWWPLWVFLGIIALALALTIGVVIGVIVVIFRILQGIVRAIQR